MSARTPPAFASLLIVDDEPEFLEILAAWFTSVGFDVRTASDGFEALRHLNERPADVVVTDLRMPGLDGLQFLGVAKELDPRTEVIFLTGHGTMADAIAALREGRAFDFITKPLKNLRQLRVVVEKALVRREAAAAPGPEHPAGPAPERAPPQVATARPWPPYAGELTTREAEIMDLVARGLENRAIAARLGLSSKTVKNYLSRIYEKLDVGSRTQALHFLREHSRL